LNVKRNHPGTELAIRVQIDDAKKDLIGAADRMYDDEDDYTDSQFGQQQPLQVPSHIIPNGRLEQLKKTRITPEFVHEQQVHDNFAASPPINMDSQPLERPSKPKKNESRMLKHPEHQYQSNS